MRSLAFFLTLALQAQKMRPPEPQAIEKIRQFASARENLSCNEVPSTANTRTVTIDFLDPTAPFHGTRSTLQTVPLFQDVFAVSSSTGFEFDHWGTLKGKKMAVYRYSNQINGKTHAGLVYADETSGAISRITFRGTDATAHLFCRAQ